MQTICVYQDSGPTEFKCSTKECGDFFVNLAKRDGPRFVGVQSSSGRTYLFHVDSINLITLESGGNAGSNPAPQ